MIDQIKAEDMLDAILLKDTQKIVDEQVYIDEISKPYTIEDLENWLRVRSDYLSLIVYGNKTEQELSALANNDVLVKIFNYVTTGEDLSDGE